MSRSKRNIVERLREAIMGYDEEEEAKEASKLVDVERR